MEKKLKWTGERLVSELNNVHGTIEHLHRYALAIEICKGKTVLDIASGEGYGSNLLSSVAAYVYGVDISEESIKHAQEKYVKDNLEYKTGSASKIPIIDNTIDVVISFETLEHHDKHDEMLNEIKRVLRPDGVLLISSPEKSIYKSRDPNNPFHIKELELSEFKDLLNNYFKQVKFFDQRFVFGSVVNNTDLKNSQGIKYYSGNFNGITNNLEEDVFYNKAFFNIAIASDSKLLLALPDSSLFSGLNVLHSIQNDYIWQIKKIKNSRAYILSQKIVSIGRRFKNLFKK